MNNRLPHSLICICLLTAFGLLILPMTGLCQTPISCGQTVTGTISAPGQTNLYIFSGSAGELVILSAHGLSNGVCTVAGVYAPAGGTLGETPCNWSSPRITLPAAGTYTIGVHNSTDTVGDYALCFQSVTAPCGPSIECGTSVAGAISLPGQADGYTINANAGDVIVINATGLSGSLNPYVSLYDPAGNRMTALDYDQSAHLSLTITGTYTLFMFDGQLQGTGGYELTWQNVNNPCNATLPLCASTTVFTDALLYNFTIPSSDNLFVTIQEEDNGWFSWNNSVALTIGGQTVASTNGYEDHLLQVANPTPGEYTLDFTGSDGGAAVVQVCTNLPVLTLGQWHVGTILRRWGSAWYQVTVPPGQASLYFAVETIGLYSQLKVYTNTVGGAVVSAAYGPSMNLTILSPAAGTYYVELEDSAWIQNGNQARDHMIKADVVPIVPPPCTTPIITSMTPTNGGTAGTVTITINGQCLASNATVCLQRSGYANVCATSVTGTSNRTVNATFDFSTAAPGDWTLLLTNPDTQVATAPTLFTVQSGGEAKLWTEIVGRSQLRIGRTQTYLVRFGNSGKLDAHDLVLTLRVPIGLSCHLRSPLSLPDWIPVTSPSQNGYYTIPVWILGLPAGAQGEIPVSINSASDNLGSQLTLTATLAAAPESEFSRTGDFSLIRTSPIFQAVVDAVAAVIQQPSQQVSRAGFSTTQVQDQRLEIEQRTEDFIRNAGVQHGWMIASPPYTGMLIGGIIGAVAAPFLGVDPWTGAGIGAGIGGLIETGISLFQATVDQLRGATDLMTSSSATLFPVSSVSPEDKYGPLAYDAAGTATDQFKRWISGNQPIDYRIDFWNKEDAPAATVDVFINDQLSSNLNWSTFTFTEIGFLDWRVPLEPCQYFNVDIPNVQIDLSKYYPGAPVVNLVVNVKGTFDPATGQIAWEFHALDPSTRQPPDNPLAGFLPPIMTNGWEVGWVDFSALPNAGLPTSTIISNQSYVKFDVDVFKPAPPGGPFVNTIDDAMPSSHVLPLAASQTAALFPVQWTGSDEGAGVRDYTIFVSEDSGSFSNWLVNTTGISGTFTGQVGHTYAFYSVACDNVGNQEAKPAAPEATTQVPLSAARDLAVTTIRAPKKVTLTDKKPSLTRIVGVQIQNRSLHAEVISNATVLANLVTLSVEAITNNCSGLTPALRVPTKLPITLKPKGKLTVLFNVTFSTNCVPDPLPTTKTGSHNDYRYSATVNLSALDALDTNPANDDCPRPPNSATGDKGCGSKNLDKTLGADVLTDVLIK